MCMGGPKIQSAAPVETPKPPPPPPAPPVLEQTSPEKSESKIKAEKSSLKKPGTSKYKTDSKSASGAKSTARASLNITKG